MCRRVTKHTQNKYNALDRPYARRDTWPSAAICRLARRAPSTAVPTAKGGAVLHRVRPSAIMRSGSSVSVLRDPHLPIRWAYAVEQGNNRHPKIGRGTDLDVRARRRPTDTMGGGGKDVVASARVSTCKQTRQTGRHQHSRWRKAAQRHSYTNCVGTRHTKCPPYYNILRNGDSSGTPSWVLGTE